MRSRRAIWALGVVLLLVTAVPLLSQSSPNTITPAVLQGRQWVYSVLQSFGAGLTTHTIFDSTASGGPNTQLSGSGPLLSGATGSVPLAQTQIDYTMPNPPTAPTVGTPTGVSGCLGSKTWQFGAAYYNRGGQTALSPFTSNQTGWATSKNIPLTRPADFPPTASHWAPAYINITDAPTVVKTCGSGAGIYSAIGTATVNCGCSGSGTTITGQANNSGLKSIFQVMDGEMRFPSYLTSSPNTLTEGARRFNFALGYPSFSPDSGTTLYDIPTTNGQSRLVCSTCRYTSIDLALASISDNAITKPYTVYMLPGTYGNATIFTLSKAYVQVVGLGPPGSVVIDGTIAIGADITGAGISNLTFVGQIAPLRGGTANTVPTTFYVRNSIVGDLTDCTVDTLHDAGSNALSAITWYSQGNIWQTCWDGLFLGRDDRFISSGDTFVGDNTNVGANQPITVFNWTNPNIEIDVSGAVFWVRQTMNCANCGAWVIGSTSSGSTGTIQPRIAISGSRIYMQSTHASNTGALRVIDTATEPGAPTNPLLISLTGTDIDMYGAGTTVDLVGIKVPADADHAGWNVSMHGGSIRRVGGDTTNSYDVDTAETASGFSVDLYGVRHEGKYSAGGGTLKVFNSPLTTGVIRNTPLATAPSTCSIGDRYADTSGADCYCKAANTWEITNATGSCV